MAFLAKALFRWNESSKNADINILSYFLAILVGFHSLYREILPMTIYMPNFRSIVDYPNRNYRGGILPPPCHMNLQKPGLFRVNPKIVFYLWHFIGTTFIHLNSVVSTFSLLLRSKPYNKIGQLNENRPSKVPFLIKF